MEIVSLPVINIVFQGCDDRSLYVVVNVLGPALFDDEGQVQALLKSTDEKNSLFLKIVALLNKLPLERLQDRFVLTAVLIIIITAKGKEFSYGQYSQNSMAH